MNRVSATFSIWSKKLQPEKISEVRGFRPDRTVVPGADRIPPRPRPTAFGWHVTCCNVNVDLPNTVMMSLVDRISPILREMKYLKKLDRNLVVNFHLNVAPKSTEIPLWIDRKAIDLIAEFGGDLDVEFFDL